MFSWYLSSSCLFVCLRLLYVVRPKRNSCEYESTKKHSFLCVRIVLFIPLCEYRVIKWCCYWILNRAKIIEQQCNNEKSTKTSVSRAAVALLAEITFNQADIFANELTHFVKHGKRKIAALEDIKLLARKHRPTLRALEEYQTKHMTKKSSKKRSQASVDSDKKSVDNRSEPVKKPKNALIKSSISLDDSEEESDSSWNTYCFKN